MGDGMHGDWQIERLKNPVSESEHVLLTKTLTSIDDPGLQVTVRLNCETLGFMSSEIESHPANIVWQQSSNDFISQGLMKATGIRTNPLSTSVQWRVGNKKQQGYAPLEKFNNVLKIPHFFDLASEAWSGTLAIVLDTDHGQLAVESTIETPNALAFIKACKEGQQEVKEDLAAEREAARAAASRAASAAYQEAMALMQRQAKHQSEPLGKMWTQYIADVTRNIQWAWVRPMDTRSDLDCLIVISQKPDGTVTRAHVVKCNGQEGVSRSIEDAVANLTLRPPPDPALYEKSLVIEFHGYDK
jgi:hypothetical protein